MKKVKLLLSLIIISIVMSACSDLDSVSSSSQPSDSQVPEAAQSSSTPAAEESIGDGLPSMSEENSALYDKYFANLYITGIFSRNFTPYSTSELLEHDGIMLLAITDIINQEEISKNDYYVKFDGIPKDLVANTITKMLPITEDVITDTLSANYNSEKESYAYLGGLGGGPSNIIITGSKEGANDTLFIYYTWYIWDEFADPPRFSEGESKALVVDNSSEDVRYLANLEDYFTPATDTQIELNYGDIEIIGDVKEDVDFLTDEQWELFDQGMAKILEYAYLPGYDAKYDYIMEDAQAETIEKNDTLYLKYRGVFYRDYNDFYEEMTGVFTDDFFQTLNTMNGMITYINNDGNLYHADTAGAGDPTWLWYLDRYELVSADEEEIEFNVVSYYADDFVTLEANLLPISYKKSSVIMINTESGWRIEHLSPSHLPLSI